MPNPYGNPQNLKPFHKGVSGNPKGGRKKRDLEQYLQEFLEQELPDKTGLDKRERAELLFRAQFKKAMNGDTNAAKFIVEHAYGRPTSRVQVTGKDGEALNPLIGLSTSQVLDELKALREKAQDVDSGEDEARENT